MITYAKDLDLKKFVREDQDIRFSKDPKDPLFEEHYFDFAEKHYNLFFVSTVEKERLDITFACKCESNSECECRPNINNWEVYVFKAWYHRQKQLFVDQIFFEHFFKGNEEKLMESIWQNDEFPETCYILKCKKCGAWYLWKS